MPSIYDVSKIILYIVVIRTAFANYWFTWAWWFQGGGSVIYSIEPHPRSSFLLVSRKMTTITDEELYKYAGVLKDKVLLITGAHKLGRRWPENIHEYYQELPMELER